MAGEVGSRLACLVGGTQKTTTEETRIQLERLQFPLDFAIRVHARLHHQNKSTRVKSTRYASWPPVVIY